MFNQVVFFSTFSSEGNAHGEPWPLVENISKSQGQGFVVSPTVMSALLLLGGEPTTVERLPFAGCGFHCPDDEVVPIIKVEKGLHTIFVCTGKNTLRSFELRPGDYAIFDDHRSPLLRDGLQAGHFSMSGPEGVILTRWEIPSKTFKDGFPFVST